MQTSSSTPTPTVVPPPTNIANLLSTLLKAGVVSANGTPVGAGATSKEEATKYEIPESVGLEREASRAYRQAILSQPIKLTSSDIIRCVLKPSITHVSLLILYNRKRPQIVELLYDQLTAQCKQCGIRFADTIHGKKDMEDHLDMHFRQNRKANQNIRRGHSRSWFVGVEVCRTCSSDHHLSLICFIRTGSTIYQLMLKAKAALMVLALLIQRLLLLPKWLSVMLNSELSLLSFPRVMRQNPYHVRYVRRYLSQNSWRTTRTGCGRMLSRRMIGYVDHFFFILVASK